MADDLKQLVGISDSTTFPGLVLSRPRLLEYAEAEEAAAVQYLQRVAKACAGLPAAVQDKIHQRATDNLRNTPFGYGSMAFDQWALSFSAVTKLAWLSLRIRKPEINENDVADLFTDPGTGDARINAVWKAWGYEMRPRSGPSSPNVTSPPNTTGGGTTQSSPSADTVMNKSSDSPLIRSGTASDTTPTS
jgi:hypothetical protein